MKQPLILCEVVNVTEEKERYEGKPEKGELDALYLYEKYRDEQNIPQEIKDFIGELADRNWV